MMKRSDDETTSAFFPFPDLDPKEREHQQALIPLSESELRRLVMALRFLLEKRENCWREHYVHLEKKLYRILDLWVEQKNYLENIEDMAADWEGLQEHLLEKEMNNE